MTKLFIVGRRVWRFLLFISFVIVLSGFRLNVFLFNFSFFLGLWAVIVVCSFCDSWFVTLRVCWMPYCEWHPFAQFSQPLIAWTISGSLGSTCNRRQRELRANHLSQVSWTRDAIRMSICPQTREWIISLSHHDQHNYSRSYSKPCQSCLFSLQYKHLSYSLASYSFSTSRRFLRVMTLVIPLGFWAIQEDQVI